MVGVGGLDGASGGYGEGTDEAVGRRAADHVVGEIVEIAFNAFTSGSVDLAYQVEPLEQVIDQLKSQMKARHIARLQRGACTTLLGFVFNDLITNYERVADHCSNIAICLIEVSKNSMDAHDYLNKLMGSYNSEFNDLYVHYVEKYQLD